jgi:hypothetical protein
LVTAGKHVNNNRAIARQLSGKWVPAAMNTHALVEVLLHYNNGNGVFCAVRVEMLRIIRVSPVLELIVDREFGTKAVKGRIYVCCSTVILECVIQ